MTPRHSGEPLRGSLSSTSLAMSQPQSRTHLPTYLQDSPVADAFEIDGASGSSASPGAMEPLYSSLSDDPFPSLPLPSAWSQKSSEKWQNLELSHHALRASYTVGAGKKDTDAASVRANHSIPPQCGLYYFEIEIISKGRDGYIGIGFCGAAVQLNRLPGWENNSWGYHGDDGHSFSCSGSGKEYGPKFTTSDIVGCCVNFLNNTAFYTKNGFNLGTAFRDLPLTKPGEPGLSVFPCIGLRTPEEKVEANFGGKKFKFDIESYFREEKQKLREVINHAPILNPTVRPTLDMATDQKKSKEKKQGSSSSLQASKNSYSNGSLNDGSFYDILNELVFSYLVHHGYAETASRFSKSIERSPLGLVAGQSSAEMDVDEATAPQSGAKGTLLSSKKAGVSDEIRNRQRIRSHILNGEIDQAIDHTNTLYPQVLPDNPKILFQLRCRKFIEMMNNAQRPKRRRKTAEMDIDTDNAVGEDPPIEDTELVEEALQYGKRLCQDYRQEVDEDIRQDLIETFSLLAYKNPRNSAVSYLLDSSRRQMVADTLNSAILVSGGQPAVPPVEVLFRQCVSVQRELLRHGNGAGAFFNVQRDLLKKS